MSENPVLFEIDGPVARITFNRPDVLNAFDRICALALLEAFRSIEADPGIRVVVMKGNGRAFMAGGDVSTFSVGPEDAPAYFKSLLDPFHEAIEIMMGLDRPVVAAVHGPVAGAGFSLAMAADLVIASSDARFTMAYTKLGVSADGSISWSLPRLVGLRKALEMALLSDLYGAEQALSLGLVNSVVPTDHFEEEAERLVQRLAAGPTIAFGRMKKLLRLSLERTLPEQLRAEEDSLIDCVVTQDFAAGVSAFQKKEKARFTGK